MLWLLKALYDWYIWMKYNFTFEAAPSSDTDKYAVRGMDNYTGPALSCCF